MLKPVDVEAAKGGRGKKGGLRERARQLGIPSSTAHDAMKEKLDENRDTRPVSEPDKPRENRASCEVSEPQVATTSASAKRQARYRRRRNGGKLRVVLEVDEANAIHALEQLGVLSSASEHSREVVEAALQQKVDDWISGWADIP